MELANSDITFAYMESNTVQIPTATEMDIKLVTMLADGLKGNQIAAVLNMNENTLAFNLKVLRGKFGCKNSLNLVAFFLRNNLIK